MQPIIYIYIAITVYILWLFWENRKMYRKDRKDASRYRKEFIKSIIHTDYKNLGKMIIDCDSPELLNICYKLILVFQKEHKGHYADDLAKDLIALYEYKESELLQLN